MEGLVCSRENGLIPDVDWGTDRVWHMVRVGSQWVGWVWAFKSHSSSHLCYFF